MEHDILIQKTSVTDEIRAVFPSVKSDHDTFKKQTLDTIGNFMLNQLTQKMQHKYETLIYETVHDSLNRDLRQMINDCIQEIVPPEFRSIVFDNFSKLFPRLILGASLPVKVVFFNTPINQHSMENFRNQFSKLLSLLVKEKFTDEIIIQVSNFQREFSKHKILDCVYKIRQTCHNIEILEILAIIESMLSNYNPTIDPLLQSLRFIIDKHDNSIQQQTPVNDSIQQQTPVNDSIQQQTPVNDVNESKKDEPKPFKPYNSLKRSPKLFKDLETANTGFEPYQMFKQLNTTAEIYNSKSPVCVQLNEQVKSMESKRTALDNAF